MATYFAELYAVAGATGLAERARAAGDGVVFLRAIDLPSDETCFLVFEAASREAVVAATRRVGLVVDRVVEGRLFPEEARS